MVTLASYPVWPHQPTGGWTNRWLVVEWLRYSFWVPSAQNDISTADLQGFWAIWKQEQWPFWFGGLKPALQDFGSFGTSMSGICYDIAKQYWEAWGLFWKRSVSPCFRGVSLGFFFLSVVVVWCWLLFVFCCFVFVLCRRHLVLLSPILQHVGIANLIKTDWWPSQLRARTAWAKKKMVGAMQRVDVILQRSKCAIGLWLPETFRGFVW